VVRVSLIAACLVLMLLWLPRPVSLSPWVAGESGALRGWLLSLVSAAALNVHNS